MEKIFITGTSGIGKTTLAEYISRKLNIPFINGSSTVIWDEFGISSHKQLLELGIREPQKGLEFQYRLLQVREELVRGVDSFVTDRTPIDNLVYFLYQNAPYLSDGDVQSYITACRCSFHRTSGYTDNKLKLIYLTRDFLDGDGMNIEDNGKRIDNHYYQDMMDNLFQHVFDKNYMQMELDTFNHARIRDYNWHHRVEIIDRFLRHRRGKLERFLKDKIDKL